MDPTCMTLLSAMGVAILALAGFIYKQYADLKQLNSERINDAKEYQKTVAEIRVLLTRPPG